MVRGLGQPETTWIILFGEEIGNLISVLRLYTGERLFPVAAGDKTKSNGIQLQQGKFQFDNQEKPSHSKVG